jgi:DNA-binding HxlR family transcriptional regulator
MGTYGQFCPIAKAMELLDERWTLLIIRELLCGSRHFNEIRSGNPKMSTALLSKRLRTLTRYGIVDRRADGNRVVYTLTLAGQELRPIVEGLGVWGTRWASDLGEQDLDPQVLLWDIHFNIDHAALPPGRTVVQFSFADVEPKLRDWWLVLSAADADVCDTDPGHEIDLAVDADLRALTAVWMGDVGWTDAQRAGTVTIHGPAPLRRAFPTWLKLSMFADVARVS